MFFSKAATQTQTKHKDPEPQASTSTDVTNLSHDTGAGTSSTKRSEPEKKHHSTPSQDRISAELSTLRAQKDALVTTRDAGLSDDDQKMKEFKADIKVREHLLKQTKKNAEYQKKFRTKRTDAIKKLTALNPENAHILAVKNEPERPRFEQEDKLLETIVDLVLLKSAADERRRMEMIRTYRSLDDLHAVVIEQGFEISRTGLYLRLLPRNCTTTKARGTWLLPRSSCAKHRQMNTKKKCRRSFLHSINQEC
ncbi:uncharacterized protein LOC129771787 [Toxorhynchites rutilus septentrionalis]|uniref:uncharacterized protein LOC129771787 n=1 Tax=Toxorhynchites rutilus septentrionalis TaxID=329112 RepID=UPI00247A7CDB|nr:uncharacterized protein LOC129771787 [Toxorhynchites rutilus septentrionalis]